MEIRVTEIGPDRIYDEMKKLSSIVLNNWKTIFEGARRTGTSIEADYWAPQRVQCGEVRLHRNYGIKCVSGWHAYKGGELISEDHVRKAADVVNSLLTEAGKEIPCSFTIEVKEK